ncbi:hypothetical protein Poli38472_012255 [Pythium oligandrum]|uniref:Uncharacterized protein n=1 Tax=Pythium oligandrum TaxID=41045 RepID=A0A8K1FNB3_PYTOL|nr:hypothetical protein Poli38472_012255 [Pythium oligandrum]|eukprot:TMW67139.1 hypothetical protein Poli38472_012255 [Pythium oligandrum]
MQSLPSRASTTLIEFPTRDNVRRSISCAEYGQADPILRGHDDDATVSQRAPRRFTIFYRDETLRENCDKNTRRMIESAKQTQQHTKESRASTCGSTAVVLSNQQRLALKALKYRNLLDRMHAIDDDRLKDPSFDVLECLGVQWCKV